MGTTCGSKNNIKSESSKMKLHLKINKQNQKNLFNFKNSSYKKKLDFILTKNLVLYIDTNSEKIFFKEKVIKNHFKKNLKQIQFRFNEEKKKIFLNFENEKKFENFLWERKIRSYLKEGLKIKVEENDFFRIGIFVIKIIKINKKNDKNNLKIKKIKKKL